MGGIVAGIVAGLWLGACDKGEQAAAGLNAEARGRAAAEVRAMISELKTRQEQHYMESNVYVSTGSSEADRFPSVAGKSEPLPSAWQELQVRPVSEVLQCRYVAIAGSPDDSGRIGPVPSRAGFSAPKTNWFYIVADCGGQIWFTSSQDNSVSQVAD